MGECEEAEASEVLEAADGSAACCDCFFGEPWKRERRSRASRSIVLATAPMWCRSDCVKREKNGPPPPLALGLAAASFASALLSGDRAGDAPTLALPPPLPAAAALRFCDCAATDAMRCAHCGDRWASLCGQRRALLQTQRRGAQHVM